MVLAKNYLERKVIHGLLYVILKRIERKIIWQHMRFVKTAQDHAFTQKLPFCLTKVLGKTEKATL